MPVQVNREKPRHGPDLRTRSGTGKKEKKEEEELN